LLHAVNPFVVLFFGVFCLKKTDGVSKECIFTEKTFTLFITKYVPVFKASFLGADGLLPDGILGDLVAVRVDGLLVLLPRVRRRRQRLPLGRDAALVVGAETRYMRSGRLVGKTLLLY